MSVVALGDKYFVTAFQLAGARGVIVEDKDKVADMVSRLVEEGEAKIIVLPEDYAVKIRKIRQQRLMSRDVYPIFVVVPGLGGGVNERLREIYTLISQAVGVKLKLEG